MSDETQEAQLSIRSTMRPSELIDFLKKTVPANLTTLIVGPPGGGKTAIAEQVAAEIGYELQTDYTSMSDSTDPKGIPFVSEDRTRADLLPIGVMADIFSATKKTLYMMDDIGNALPAVMTGYMHILHSRSIAGRRLPDCVSVIASTNRIQDKCNVFPMPESMKSRFDAIIEFENTADDFIRYAQAKPKVFSDRDISFIRSRPSLLHAFKPSRDFKNSPCPRTWESAANLFRLFEPGLPPMAAIIGAVGEGAAIERLGFERIYARLPDTKEIFAKPEEAPVPEDPSVRYALCGMLAKQTTKQNAAKVFTYFERLGPEFSVLAVKDAVGYNPSLVGTKVFRDNWLKKHPEIMM